MTGDLFESDPLRNLLPFDGEVYDHGRVLRPFESHEAFELLSTTIGFAPDSVMIRGELVRTSRFVAMHGDTGVSYRYSGARHEARPWTPELLALKGEVERRAEATFNVCLLNLYPDGNAGLGWHSDDEPELGPEPTIASLSLGAARRFMFRHKYDGNMSMELCDGQLIVMRGVTQKHWQHQLAKDPACRHPRMNLTFRTITTETT